MNCTCNDESMTKTINCFKCGMTWQTQIPYHERVSTCPVHRTSIAICGSTGPQLCSQCTNEGQYVERQGTGWFPAYEVKKK